jgi:signal transduction histidine kinase
MQCTGHGKVEVMVSDSGPGIPEEVIDEIFDTFYTTRPNGTGLGLSIARIIVETYWDKTGLLQRNKPPLRGHVR